MYFLCSESWEDHNLMPADSVSCEAPLAPKMAPSCCVLTWQKDKRTPSSLFHNGTNPFMRTFDLITSQRLDLLIPSPWRLGFIKWILERYKHLDHCTAHSDSAGLRFLDHKICAICIFFFSSIFCKFSVGEFVYACFCSVFLCIVFKRAGSLKLGYQYDLTERCS
jgi:hypothetical protein